MLCKLAHYVPRYTAFRLVHLAPKIADIRSYSYHYVSCKQARSASISYLNSLALRDGLRLLPRSPDDANVRQTETSLPWDSVVDDTKVRIQHAIEGLKHVLTNLKDPFDQELLKDTLDAISRTPDRPSPHSPAGKDQTRSPSRASVLQARLRWADTVPEARTRGEPSNELVDASRAILRVAVDKMAVPVFESDIESSKWRANAQKSAKLAEELQALLVEATKDRDEKERRNGMLQADLIAKIAELREKEEDRAGWQLERARLLADLQAEQERHASRAPQLQSLATLLASKEQVYTHTHTHTHTNTQHTHTYMHAYIQT
jgi:hypothetical protein